MSKENPFRFSTKRIVDSIDIILYEYRAYSPSLGRWLSRDLIGEKGFALLSNNKLRMLYDFRSLYTIVGNDTVNQFDVLGLMCPKNRLIIGS